MDKSLHQFRVGLVAAWFGASFTCLILAVFLNFYLTNTKVVTSVNQNFKAYAAVPKNVSEVRENISVADARPKIIENFFHLSLLLPLE